MTADAHLHLAALQVDGGAAANDWLMQFQADLLGVPVARPDVVETTALGLLPPELNYRMDFFFGDERRMKAMHAG